MNIFGSIVNDVTRSYCAINNLPTGRATMYGFDEEREYGRMLEANHDDLMDQLKYAELAKVIIHDHDLCDGDLLQELMTATAMWNEKPETALDRLKAIHRLVWLAIDRIAQDMTEKEFSAMLERS